MFPLLPVDDMLSDPLIPAVSSLAPTNGAGTNTNFRRIGTGIYSSVENVYSQDQPAELRITSKPKFGSSAPSSFSVSAAKWINVPPINGVPQSDDRGSVQITLTGPMRSFTQAHFQELLNNARIVLEANFARILGGEV